MKDNDSLTPSLLALDLSSELLLTTGPQIEVNLSLNKFMMFEEKGVV